MPIYTYNCNRCGNTFDELVPLAKADDVCRKACEKCGDTSVVRCLGVPAVHMRYSPMHPRHMRGQRRRPTK